MLHDDVMVRFKEYLSSPPFIWNLLYWCISTMIALFILQVSDKFGQGVLMKFLVGLYHKPKEEIRIFMFPDLTSSTTLAEKLGHIKYSQLIQDCFLTLPIL